MTMFYISGSKINNNRGTIKAIGNNDRSDINNSLTSNTIVNGGSILIDSNSTDPAYSDGIFSFNNNKPLYMPYSNSLAGVDDKKINGNYPIQNRSKTIRSTLTSTAIRQGKYNYFNNTFDTNYPVNTSYDLCPDVLTVTYELGQKQPLVKNDNPSDCDQFYVPPTPTIVGYVADSSFGDAAGTYCPAGTYDNVDYYSNSNGWLMWRDGQPRTHPFLGTVPPTNSWRITQASIPGQTWIQSYAQSEYTASPSLTNWVGGPTNATNLTLTSGTVCFDV